LVKKFPTVTEPTFAAVHQFYPDSDESRSSRPVPLLDYTFSVIIPFASS